MALSLKDFIETAGSIYIAKETLDSQGSQMGYANNPEDFPRIATGKDSNNETLNESQPVLSDQNAKLLIGGGFLLAAVALTALVARPRKG